MSISVKDCHPPKITPTSKNIFIEMHINTNTATPIAQTRTEKLPILAVNLFANGRLQGSVLLFVFDLVLARGSCQLFAGLCQGLRTEFLPILVVGLFLSL